MNIWTYKYNGKDYPFKLTRAARKAINELQFKIFDELQNPEILTMAGELSEIQQKLNAAKMEDNKSEMEDNKSEMEDNKSEMEDNKSEIAQYEAELNALSIKMMPLMKDFVKLQSNDIDPEEIAAILLKENKDLKGEMTDQFIDDMFDDMVNTLGMEKFDEKMVEITARVFTVIQLLKDKLEAINTVKKEKTKNPLPMS
ncbi:hypothetical protein MKA33_12500 [[Clostridium] innocuum]|uniref:coiled-coil domain-containing protein n=1 Tax=Clostridium innocuum TaxID=1522 RepID=UPI0006C62DCC|nr:hypothetical protein [[Clostridium] innocuum]ANU69744.1 hypothetical protein A4V01_12740 [Erysipelotrichaceae bacterium I46]WAK79504.1 hypothetical protein [Clostridium phage Maintenon]ASU17818.1 hypothetical protein ADH65_04525 [[Clostridium] innocuum]MCR0150118.1 hypothetical protein [[Clostridium] innocuum]MCR0314480.1 hypothetical protein [[Clostridium] innocuum]